ncbi:hypothetical protein GCM10007904_37240 [Oharaeibacter diazotrophicus]|nr:hypothetical protein GCM10007904_37240 [Oharaeibacter diazotrophicus]
MGSKLATRRVASLATGGPFRRRPWIAGRVGGREGPVGGAPTAPGGRDMRVKRASAALDTSEAEGDDYHG